MTDLAFDFTEQDMQEMQTLAGWLPDVMKMEDSVWNLDDKALDALTASNLDTGVFFTSPDSSPISPFENAYSSSPSSSSPFAENDFHPEGSSSDEETSFVLDNQLADALGLSSIQSINPQTDLFEFNSLLRAENQGSAFQNSSLPPLPVAEVTNNQTEEEPFEKKAKKRRRNQQDTSVSAKLKSSKFVPLSGEELLKLDSQEIEEYIKTYSSMRTLAPSEEKELKRVRRLIKNREYAQSSRNKKKQYMEEMEKKLADVAEGKVALQQRVSELEQENKVLKTQLAKIGIAMKRDPSLLEKLKTATQTHTSRKAGPQVLRTGVVLFMVVLSFGFFFSPEPQKQSIYNTGRRLLITQYLIPPVLANNAPDFIIDYYVRIFHPELPTQDDAIPPSLDDLPKTTRTKVTILRKEVPTTTINQEDNSISEIPKNPCESIPVVHSSPKIQSA